jgi:hypothetical protein
MIILALLEKVDNKTIFAHGHAGSGFPQEKSAHQVAAPCRLGCWSPEWSSRQAQSNCSAVRQESGGSLATARRHQRRSSHLLKKQLGQHLWQPLHVALCRQASLCCKALCLGGTHAAVPSSQAPTACARRAIPAAHMWMTACTPQHSRHQGTCSSLQNNLLSQLVLLCLSRAYLGKYSGNCKA